MYLRENQQVCLRWKPNHHCRLQGVTTLSMCQCHSCVPLAVSSVDPIFLFFSQHQVTSVSHSIVEVVEVTFNSNLNVHVITPLAKCLMSNTGFTYYYNCSTKDGQGNPMYLSFPLPAQGKI